MVIFDTTKLEVDCASPAWDAQMRDIVNCRNLTIEENEENPRNITIFKSEGKCTAIGPSIESLYVTKPLKIRQLNIGSKEQPKLANIEDYWHDDMV